MRPGLFRGKIRGVLLSKTGSRKASPLPPDRLRRRIRQSDESARHRAGSEVFHAFGKRSGIIVNLHERGKRIGYLELTPGVGDSKSPGKWMDTVLLP